MSSRADPSSGPGARSSSPTKNALNQGVCRLKTNAIFLSSLYKRGFFGGRAGGGCEPKLLLTGSDEKSRAQIKIASWKIRKVHQDVTNRPFDWKGVVRAVRDFFRFVITSAIEKPKSALHRRIIIKSPTLQDCSLHGKGWSGKSVIHIRCQCFLYAFMFGGGIFQLAGGQTSSHDAASLICRLIFHVFASLVEKHDNCHRLMYLASGTFICVIKMQNKWH